MKRTGFASALLGFSAMYAAAVLAQRTDAFVASRDHPAINYSKGPVADRVDSLNARLQDGSAKLEFDETTGYLKAVLEALKIPVESQVAVFAQNSFQAERINLRNPRTLFFNDAVAVGYVRGGKVLEVASLDPRQGVIFYALNQTSASPPQFSRNDNCLACHLSWSTLGVPGFFVLSMQTLPEDKYAYASGFVSDDRTPFDTRWGGWYVTGSLGGIRHIGNKPVSTASRADAVPAEDHELKSLADAFDTSGYLTASSDVAALLVLEHQTHMANLITRMGWETRLAAAEPNAKTQSRLEEAAADLVDSLLFVYEAPLPHPVRGSSGFSERFATLGPADAAGRSLRQLDLDRRLMRYPCSYMIYSEAFDALPGQAKDLVYRRLWRILGGQDKTARYDRLSSADRRAIVEILRATKKELPDYFQ
jgi:hypothetical protein